ncbi:DUF349 domain-containing protein [Actinomyces bowdenii]|uniref:DUF349 domain-containing protein n=1 Tax=Actinomyces bowdenii TaxID=131109 RepID=A0A853EKU4_9ACTO|nr:DUF349 domain-containing protein [Actinomyces bowdenii]MBF0697705.1 DUF349 domain-containing protein [Actinomyces bowdenii]NYS69878.1 DUF349 domain-containing protein [Actinomyces bowdenii]
MNPTAASTAQAQDPAVDDAPSTSGASAPVTTPTAEPQEQPAATTEADSSQEPGPQAPESPSSESQDDPANTTAEEPAQDEAPGAPEPAERPEPAQTPATTQSEDSEQQTDQGAAEETASPQEASSAPTPTPGEVPAPSAAAPSAPAAPAEPPVDPQEAMDAAKWGRVDGEGRVFVQDGGAEREVGQFPDAPVAEAMAFYVRRYLDLKATIDLFATRLPHLSVREIDSTLKSIEESLAQPAAVGDLEGLRARFAALRTVAAERRTAVAAERAAAKEQALKDRTAIVERAEAIAAQDPARTQWKNSGAELRELLETWKEAQRRGPRLDRSSEDGLWKRFSHARTTFDRHRRQFFSELDAKQSKVKAAKEALIKRAEELQHSTDWAGTSAKYRDLMAEWKKAGRASRKEDDALWARFRAAQQVFFDARRAKDEAVDAEFAENLKVKEALVAKAEALLPIKDIKAAKKALRPIQDAWEEAGRVPRSALRRIEGRMRAVEDAIREAENAEWRRTDPETKARAEGLAGQLEDAIASLEKELDAARASGDAKKVAEAEAALTARRAWLDQVRRSAKA